MLPKKHNKIYHAPAKKKWLFLALLLVFSLLSGSLLISKMDPASYVQAQKQNDEKGIKKKEKKIEREFSVIRNADTPHAFEVAKRKLGSEKEPDLSSSKLKCELISEGEKAPFVRYTIAIINNGNAKATDIDAMVEMDSKLSTPEKFTYKHCGSKIINTSMEGVVDLSNITIKREGRCTIEYEAVVKEDGDLTNRLYISPAAEGGEEIGPIECKSFKTKPAKENENGEKPKENAPLENTENDEAENIIPAQEEEIISENPAPEPDKEKENIETDQ